MLSGTNAEVEPQLHFFACVGDILAKGIRASAIRSIRWPDFQVAGIAVQDHNSQ